MDYFNQITTLLMELLDLEDADQITPETYLIRDLGVESIDLLELAVSLNATFKLEIKDNDIFLLNLRQYIHEAQTEADDSVRYLSQKLPHLPQERLARIIQDLEHGPTLKIIDIINYLEWQSQQQEQHDGSIRQSA